jgi:hypothetical protein
MRGTTTSYERIYDQNQLTVKGWIPDPSRSEKGMQNEYWIESK